MLEQFGQSPVCYTWLYFLLTALQCCYTLNHKTFWWPSEPRARTAWAKKKIFHKKYSIKGQLFVTFVHQHILHRLRLAHWLWRRCFLLGFTKAIVYLCRSICCSGVGAVCMTSPEPSSAILVQICGWFPSSSFFLCVVSCFSILAFLHVFVINWHSTNSVDSTIASLTPLFSWLKGVPPGINPSSRQQKKKRSVVGSTPIADLRSHCLIPTMSA